MRTSYHHQGKEDLSITLLLMPDVKVDRPELKSVSPLFSCVTLNWVLYVPEPQFLLIDNKDKNTCIIG